jgi:hypothetical protein
VVIRLTKRAARKVMRRPVRRRFESAVAVLVRIASPGHFDLLVQPSGGRLAGPRVHDRSHSGFAAKPAHPHGRGDGSGGRRISVEVKKTLI